LSDYARRARSRFDNATRNRGNRLSRLAPALPSLKPLFESKHLLLHFGRRFGYRLFEFGVFADGGKNVIAPVQDDFGPLAVFLGRNDDVTSHWRRIEYSVELPELLANQTFHGWCYLYVSTSELVFHLRSSLCFWACRFWSGNRRKHNRVKGPDKLPG